MCMHQFAIDLVKSSHLSVPYEYYIYMGVLLHCLHSLHGWCDSVKTTVLQTAASIMLAYMLPSVTGEAWTHGTSKSGVGLAQNSSSSVRRRFIVAVWPWKHHASLIIHHSSFITHHSSLIVHRSSPIEVGSSWTWMLHAR
jgi:hypothetical protein